MSGRDILSAVYFGGALTTWLLFMLVRRLAILRTVRQRAPASDGWIGWSMYRDARRYRELCQTGEARLGWWYCFWALHWLFVATVLASFAVPSLLRLGAT